jgi:acetyl-CoA C-acetyltransferase
VQINRYCASGLEACNMATAKVMAGQSPLAVGGGVESMSRVPMGTGGGAWPADPAVALPTYFVPQGISADLIATLYGHSRGDVDAYALESQRRAAAAWQEGRFAKSIVPVRDVNGLVVLDRDEHMRPETTIESLTKLEPSFKLQGERAGFDAVALQRYPQLERIEHVHHAGNSSGIVDGAAAVLIGNAEVGKRLGLKPRARIRSFASVGSEPTIMLTGPSFSAEKALKLAGMSCADIDLFELNEAFASVVLRFMEVMNVPHDRMNVNGGAIAIGHPIGASGARVLVTLLAALETFGLKRGVASLCIGGGEATAIAIELI